jgi:hypothetical protein
MGLKRETRTKRQLILALFGFHECVNCGRTPDCLVDVIAYSFHLNSLENSKKFLSRKSMNLPPGWDGRKKVTGNSPR